MLRCLMKFSVFLSLSVTCAVAWKQRGGDIDGEAAGDRSGWSVSLSADGTTLAVGAIFNAGAGSNAGHARVFAWDPVDETWKQRGDDIDGEAAYDLSGWAVSLSADGTALAVGAPYNDDRKMHWTLKVGHARVYIEAKPDASGGAAGEFGQGDGDLVASGDEDGPACDSEEGRDSRSWHRKDAPTKTCAWVERKPSRRCRKKDATGARA